MGIKKAAILGVLFQAIGALALDSFPGGIEQITNAGSGCPAGSLLTNISPDGQEVQFFPHSLVAQAGGKTGATLGRSTCNVAIPLNVPAGWSVALSPIEVHGFVGAPAGTTTQISYESFFAGAQGAKTSKTFAGPMNSNFVLSNTLAGVKFSACGQDVIARINLSAIARTNSRRDAVVAAVDTFAGSQGGVRLLWQRCQ